MHWKKSILSLQLTTTRLWILSVSYQDHAYFSFKSSLYDILFQSGIEWYFSEYLILHLPTSLPFFAGGLSWYVYDAGQVIATTIAKNPSDRIDRGDSLGFQEFIQSWVGFELVKVLNIFGLQPKIRPDLEAWSPDLFATFSYLCIMRK